MYVRWYHLLVIVRENIARSNIPSARSKSIIFRRFRTKKRTLCNWRY